MTGVTTLSTTTVAMAAARTERMTHFRRKTTERKSLMLASGLLLSLVSMIEAR